jgi:hypothetical protein
MPSGQNRNKNRARMKRKEGHSRRQQAEIIMQKLAINRAGRKKGAAEEIKRYK